MCVSILWLLHVVHHRRDKQPSLYVLQPTSWDFCGLSQSFVVNSVEHLWQTLASGELGQELRLLGYTKDTHDAVLTVKEVAIGIKNVGEKPCVL